MFDGIDPNQLMQSVSEGMDHVSKGLSTLQQALSIAEKVKAMFKKKPVSKDQGGEHGVPAAADGDGADVAGVEPHEHGELAPEERLGQLESLAVQHAQALEEVREATQQLGQAVQMLADAVIRNGQAVIRNGDAVLAVYKAVNTDVEAIARLGDAVQTDTRTLTDHAGRIMALQSAVDRLDGVVQRLEQ
ncbi:hypothetical protein PG2029B_1089 [Bifidobacterium pseudolongum subsp. globosum]|uniref:Uncharacterized protein n=1 Tax=Bifidobacterium pseudolongum subsp. globosum TaxID=1690 RepID=A0A4Q5AEW9_9BIFI|nr:hypothetical protein [Bifidobacterium pseudolongum]RYQ26492.1 hypothetical protein PG2032B_1088 [Bifidobacterium pseudolongum subsp. globosum]RYQ28484.1 hypothetical protein PG2029B_1089 [Bifidobacterium pseudolongum subsp. globosum]